MVTQRGSPKQRQAARPAATCKWPKISSTIQMLLFTSTTRPTRILHPLSIGCSCSVSFIICPFPRTRESYTSLAPIERCLGHASLAAIISARRSSPITCYQSCCLRCRGLDLPFQMQFMNACLGAVTPTASLRSNTCSKTQAFTAPALLTQPTHPAQQFMDRTLQTPHAVSDLVTRHYHHSIPSDCQLHHVQIRDRSSNLNSTVRKKASILDISAQVPSSSLVSVHSSPGSPKHGQTLCHAAWQLDFSLRSLYLQNIGLPYFQFPTTK